MNEGYVYTEILDVVADGRTLLQHMVQAHRHSDAETWQARIAAGELSIDDVTTTSASAPLRTGQHVAWHKPPWIEPDAPRDIVVIHDDDDIIAVHKPAGLPTLPGAGFLQNTLLMLVRALSSSTSTASPVHRLDRGTSGLVLFAKTADAARGLQQQWDRGAVDKRYRALVHGVVVDDVVVVEAPIGQVPDAIVHELFAATPTGKRSRSTLRVVERRDRTTVVDVELGTGRPHQIRIHTAFIGHPLVDDPVYGVGGGRAVGSTARPGDGGFMLHAHTLTFTHPRSGERLVLEAPPPVVLEMSAP